MGRGLVAGGPRREHAGPAVTIRDTLLHANWTQWQTSSSLMDRVGLDTRSQRKAGSQALSALHREGHLERSADAPGRARFRYRRVISCPACGATQPVTIEALRQAFCEQCWLVWTPPGGQENGDSTVPERGTSVSDAES